MQPLLLSKSIGSRYDITQYWIKTDEIICGCFKSTLEEFKQRVLKNYPSGKFHDQYIEFIEQCENLRK